MLGFVSSAAWLGGYLFWSRRIDRWLPLHVMGLSFGVTVLLPLCYLLSPTVWLLNPRHGRQRLRGGRDRPGRHQRADVDVWVPSSGTFMVMNQRGSWSLHTGIFYHQPHWPLS
jgi:hypothetical protein